MKMIAPKRMIPFGFSTVMTLVFAVPMVALHNDSKVWILILLAAILYLVRIRGAYGIMRNGVPNEAPPTPKGLNITPKEGWLRIGLRHAAWAGAIAWSFVFFGLFYFWNTNNAIISAIIVTSALFAYWLSWKAMRYFAYK